MSAGERWSDLAAAYVLEALEPEERADFEARLARDAGLRAEVDAYREVVAGMAQALPGVTPPPSLEARILAEARAARPTGTAPPASEVPGGGDRGADRASGEVPRRGRGWTPWLAAAAVVVALGVGWVARGLDRERAALADRLEEVRTQLADVRTELAERDSLLATFLGPDVRSVALSATDRPPSARIYWNRATSTVVVAAFGLPPAPSGRVYQLWGIVPGEDPVSLGTFQTEADGTALVQRSVTADADFEIGAVTEEPAGGSPQPTSAPFLVGTWTGA